MSASQAACKRAKPRLRPGLAKISAIWLGWTSHACSWDGPPKGDHRWCMQACGWASLSGKVCASRLGRLACGTRACAMRLDACTGRSQPLCVSNMWAAVRGPAVQQQLASHGCARITGRPDEEHASTHPHLACCPHAFTVLLLTHSVPLVQGQQASPGWAAPRRTACIWWLSHSRLAQHSVVAWVRRSCLALERRIIPLHAAASARRTPGALRPRTWGGRRPLRGSESTAVTLMRWCCAPARALQAAAAEGPRLARAGASADCGVLAEQPIALHQQGMSERCMAASAGTCSACTPGHGPAPPDTCPERDARASPARCSRAPDRPRQQEQQRTCRHCSHEPGASSKPAITPAMPAVKSSCTAELAFVRTST